MMLTSVLVPIAGRRSAGDGDAALLFLLHPVHSGGAVVDFADLMGNARIVEDALGSRGLTGIDVRHDADVARLFECCIARHLARCVLDALRIRQAITQLAPRAADTGRRSRNCQRFWLLLGLETSNGARQSQSRATPARSTERSLRGITTQLPVLTPAPDDSGFRAHKEGDFVAPTAANARPKKESYGRGPSAQQIATLPAETRAALTAAPLGNVVVRRDGRVVSAEKGRADESTRTLSERVLDAAAAEVLAL